MISMKLKDNSVTRIMIAEKGKSLREFSKMIGISHAYLSQILNCKRDPSPTVGYKIANGLGLNVEDIFLIKMVDESTKR